MAQDLSGYDLIIVGAGVASWALANALPADMRVLVVEGSGVEKVEVKHHGVFKSFEHASILSRSILGGMSGFWHGHLYTPDPTSGELAGWPRELRKSVLDNLGWAAKLLRQSPVPRVGMSGFSRISSSYPPDISEPNVWPANVDLMPRTFVTRLVQVEGVVVGFSARVFGSDTESEFRAGGASFVLAAGGVFTSEILRESFFPLHRGDSIREHLVGPLGFVKAPASFFGRGEGKVANPLSRQVQTSMGERTRSGNVLFYKSYDLDHLRATRYSRLLRIRAALLRFLDHLFPWRPIRWELQVVSEVFPSKASISLLSSGSRANARTIEIHCSPSPDDWDALDRVVADLPKVLGLPGDRGHEEAYRLGVDRSEFGGGGHFLCATPASADSDALVGLDLRVRTLKNLWACSSSVFPTGVAANPTKILCALSKSVAEQVALHIDLHRPNQYP